MAPRPPNLLRSIGIQAALIGLWLWWPEPGTQTNDPPREVVPAEETLVDVAFEAPAPPAPGSTPTEIAASPDGGADAPPAAAEPVQITPSVADAVAAEPPPSPAPAPAENPPPEGAPSPAEPPTPEVRPPEPRPPEPRPPEARPPETSSPAAEARAPAAEAPPVVPRVSASAPAAQPAPPKSPPPGPPRPAASAVSAAASAPPSTSTGGTNLARAAAARDGIPLRVYVPDTFSGLMSHLRTTGGCLAVSRKMGAKYQVIRYVRVESDGRARVGGQGCEGVGQRLAEVHNRALGDPVGQVRALVPPAEQGEGLVLQVLLNPGVHRAAEDVLARRYPGLPAAERPGAAVRDGVAVACDAEPAGGFTCR